MTAGPVEPYANEEGRHKADGAEAPSPETAPKKSPRSVLNVGPKQEIDLSQFARQFGHAPLRLRHLMYLVAAVAVCLSIGLALADSFVFAVLVLVAGLVLAFGSLMGAGIILARRLSTRQDALLWVLAIAAERNMPLTPAVAAFADQYRGMGYRRVMQLAAILNWGTQFPEALERARGLVSRDSVLLAWVGQASGLLPKALRMAATSRSTQLPIWTAIAARISYVLVILLVMQTISGFLLYFIMPKFESIFNDFGAPLPRATVALIHVSHFIMRYGSPSLLLPFIEIGLLIFLPFSFLGWGSYHVPVFDRMLSRRHTALILRSLSLIVEGNKPISLGLSTLAAHYPTLWVRRKLSRASADVRQGVDWIEALWKRGLIRATDAEVLSSAVAVGNLPWALAELSEICERRLASRFQAVIQTLFPLIVVMLGIVVCIMALAYFMPLVQLVGRLADRV